MNSNEQHAYQGIPIDLFMDKAFRKQIEPKTCWAACLEMCAKWIAEEQVSQDTLANLYGGWSGMSPDQFARVAASVELKQGGAMRSMRVAWREVLPVTTIDEDRPDLMDLSLLRTVMLLPLCENGLPGTRPWSHLAVLLGVSFTGGTHDDDLPLVHSLELADPAIGRQTIDVPAAQQPLMLAVIN